MKQCPKCQTTYDDDNLQFCLQDGTRLEDLSPAAETVHFETEPETVVSPKRVEPIRFDVPSSYPTTPPSWEQQQSQPVIIEQREAKKPNTAMVVALSVLGTVALLGLGGLGAWLYFDNQKTEVAVNINAAPNRSANQNVNAAGSPSPTPTPTPQPTLRPEDAKAITKDVEDALDDWKDSTENRNVDRHIARYADAVDYYKAGRVNIARVRADRQSAFNTYDSLIVNLDNIKVTPDASGEKATVVLDKQWDFEGAEKFSSGKVQQQLTLNRVNGRWLIAGEKDLKIYYVNKPE